MPRLTGNSLEEILDQYATENDVNRDDLVYTVIENENPEETVVTVDVSSPQDVEDFLYNYLNHFFTGVGIDVDVKVSKDDIYKVSLNAENNAMIIGRGGQTLEALNTVVKGAVSSYFHRRIPVSVDINGYKEERYERIEHMVRKVARDVEKTHQSALLDPMPADERKVVHQYLNNWEHIRTASEGEGSDRAVRIIYVENKTEDPETTTE